MQSDNTSRTCIKCGVSKPLTGFYANHSAKGGVMGCCKTCRIAQDRQWRIDNPERAKAIQVRASLRYKEKHASDEEFHTRNRARRRQYYSSPEGTATREAWKSNRKDRMLFLWCRGRCKSHGITLERYEELLRAQNHVCGICYQPEQRRGAKGGMWSLGIDHDHRCCPGRFGCPKCVRGLLCAKCNQAIALFSEDTHRFENAVAYLSRGRCYDADPDS
jgi:hypothetical protein